MRECLLILATLAGLLAVGIPARSALRRWGIPPAASLIVLGVVCGPSLAGVLPHAWLDARPSLSAAAFVILLLRAGLALAPGMLRRIALPSLTTGLVPVAAEFAVATAVARGFLFDSWSMSVLAGFLVAAVSPAVILPAMLARQERVTDDPRGVSQWVIGQTLVNALAATIGILITLELIAPRPGGPGAQRLLLMLPAALLIGAALGTAAAALLRVDLLVDAGRRRGQWAAAAMIAVGVALYLGSSRAPWLDGVAGTLAFALAVRRRLGRDDATLRETLRRSWSVGEIVLFVNLGSAIRLEALSDPGPVARVVPLLALALGVRWLVARALCRRAALVESERRLITTAHLPKATIQAVFGALPLLTFQQFRPELVAQGEMLLVLAALSILATAPAGAWALERTMAQAARPVTTDPGRAPIPDPAPAPSVRDASSLRSTAPAAAPSPSRKVPLPAAKG